MEAPLTENVAILCGEGVSVQKVSQAVTQLGFNPTRFPQSPTAGQKQQLQTWLRGATRGLLVTSNLQFAGMEASTCVFITNNLVEETGARSGLLRATSRLVVLSFTKDINQEEVKMHFLVPAEWRKEELREKEKEKRKEEEERRREEERKMEE